jgi:thioredoxin reductase
MTDSFDAAIIGGGPTGLSAALVLGRARRRVMIFDSGSYRNQAAAATHGLISRDGVAPRELLAAGRADLGKYPNVEIRSQQVVDARFVANGIELMDENRQVVATKKLIVATGVADVLPPIDNIQQFWGTSVLHCPYCHGWECRDKPLAAVGEGDLLSELTILLWGYSKDLIVCTQGTPLSDSARAAFARRNIPVYETPITSLRGSEKQLQSVVFADGTEIPRHTLFIKPQQRQNGDWAVRFGLLDEGRFRLDQRGQTKNPNIFFAGDLVPLFPPQTVTSAIHCGVVVATAVNFDLAREAFVA